MSHWHKLVFEIGGKLVGGLAESIGHAFWKKPLVVLLMVVLIRIARSLNPLAIIVKLCDRLPMLKVVWQGCSRSRTNSSKRN